MKRNIFIAFVILLLVTGGIFVQARENNPKIDKEISEYLPPEENGIYDIPGHPEMKVRVFVHHPKIKMDKKGENSSSLVCDDDPSSDAVVSPAGWHLPNGQWVYRLNTISVPSSVGSNNFNTIAQLSFSAWQNAINSKVTFVSGSPTSINRAKYDGQNIVAWGRTSGSALAVTYTWYYPNTGLVAETDTIINQKFPWSWTDQSLHPTCGLENSYDAQNILTHEIGHWMGLNDEYANEYINNTMYGYGFKAEVKKDTLTGGDINGVKSIY